MMLFIAAVVGFVVWKLRAGDQTSYAYYVILFGGDVQGLTVDSPVYYRGLRVGRVHDIELTSRKDIQRSTVPRAAQREKIEVTVAVDLLSTSVSVRTRCSRSRSSPAPRSCRSWAASTSTRSSPRRSWATSPILRSARAPPSRRRPQPRRKKLLVEGRHHGRSVERGAEPDNIASFNERRCATSRPRPAASPSRTRRSRRRWLASPRPSPISKDIRQAESGLRRPHDRASSSAAGR